ncbi:MAG: Rieske (2Fe-2S) protein [candidate division Zixibacteria bacterium]|nr:Rieske (2Fe-2S) protein [candidate division Zixibacteria bacterium]NIR62881.1 Rieske (2Fe-2S) protein [candidate division Zixibacteria bacterium]NIS15989.1 Rieske (2Fe-2S) protein [candidate division Zixibacteria bacterium]NIS44896.1 Rieske (2Fe-2S) protein [candidate division Zixibacteria bacterium]NIT52398.1 Rieske (2Fe-2S) protein [candidate division Zixibacteria bacterium]
MHGWAILKIKDKQILFVRDSKDTIKALNPICTHKQCTVEYSKEKGHIVCPCHGSEYELNGKVLKDPATEPLGIYESELREDGLIVLSLEEMKYTEKENQNNEPNGKKKEQKDGR